MKYSINEIAEVTNATLLGNGDAAAIVEYVLLDSRKLLYADKSIFFAIASNKRNGAVYIPELYSQGVRSFVVGKNEDVLPLEKANFLVVENVLAALQDWAAYHRSKFDVPVIGVVGSNGKTIVKEWLNQMLQTDFGIVRSPKSYNSQIGVPLSVLQMDADHQLAIFEAGISEPGEMDALAKIIQPTIGVFTYFGNAHAENFEDGQQKLDEKLKFFAKAKRIIFNNDDAMVAASIMQMPNAGKRVFAWGRNENSFLQIGEVRRELDKSIVDVRFSGKNAVFHIPFADAASVHNALTVAAVLLAMGFGLEDVANRLQILKPVGMRLELLQGINNCSIINDAYSADISSLSIAFDFLQQQKQHQRKTIVLSDFLQAEKDKAALYHQIAEIINRQGLYRFVGIGPELLKYQHLFANAQHRIFFGSTDELMKNFHRLQFRDETILLKGARAFGFERISAALEQKMHQTVLEINLAAVRHNINVYRSLVKPGTRLMAMVKAFSYGSGSFEIANLLQYAGVNYLGVAYADEAVALRKAGIKLPIMVMNIDENNFGNIVDFELEPEIFSVRLLSLFTEYLAQRGKTCFPVHIKLDTGMHRLGFEEKDMDELQTLLNSNTIKVQSVFTHLAGSDDDQLDYFTHEQADRYLKMCGQIKQGLNADFLRHICNSSAIARFPQYHFDMVRLGIGMYGFDANENIQERLQTVTQLKTTIAQIREVAPGETIGYSRKGIVAKPSKIATVRIGYADGFPRSLGNGRGNMLVNGKYAPTIGNVCMDMTMLDITGIEAAEEDVVTVFGENLSAKDVAKSSMTISYEVLTSVSQRVKRVYFEE